MTSPNTAKVIPLLRLVGISKAFSGVQALKDVCFDLYPGEVHALVGENGAGKSTLIKVMAGAHSPDSGMMEVEGIAITDNDPSRARTLGIATIYQQPALFPDLSVAENIALALEPPGAWRRVKWAERRDRATQLLTRIGAEIDPEVEVRRLTMPQQQLVEIARAIGSEARVLIMDEPTSSLSDREVENLFRVIRELKAQNVGIIYISHRLEELPRIADRVTALRDGILIGTRAMEATSRSELIRMMVGRELSTVFPKCSVKIGETLLEVKGAGCRSTRIHDVCFHARAGEILGIAGLIGAGRTELARLLFGLTPADSGTIELHGTKVKIDSPGRAVSLGIAYVPEDRRRHGVVMEMSVVANMTLAILRELSRFGILNQRNEQSIANSFVSRLRVKTSSIDAPVSSLSGGNQQKVALARWLATKPTILILDEPTQGVDVGAKAEIHRLMGELAAQGMAIIMISSELPEILGMSDRIAVMHGGTIVGILGRDQANQENVIELALGHLPTGKSRKVSSP